MNKAAIDLNALSAKERTALLVQLLDKSPLKHIPLDELSPQLAIMLFAADDVPPGEVVNTSPVRSFFEWRAARLVVLGPEENAAAWSLHSLYSGAASVVPLSPNQYLPLFSETDGPALFEPFRVFRGLDVNLAVSHHLPKPTSFRALLLGKRLP